MSKQKKEVSENTAGKEKALQHALDEIHKKYGQGSIMKLGDTDAKLDIGAISTGSISIDMITGIGGVPRGRVVEVYGPESSGKTTLCLHIVAEAQKAGGRAAFIDAEHALDPDYARNLGVDLDELIISQPDYGEQALEIVEMLARSASLDVIVVDSVAALVPKAELDGEMGDVMVGVQARLMSKALRKLAGVANKTGTTLIFINQIREKIGVMWGSPETTVGGRALKFFSSMRIDVRKADVIKNGQDFLGNRTKIKIVKNKVAAPFKTAEVNIIYGKGISKTTDLIDSAIELGIIEKAGAWLVYGETKLQGKDKFENYLESNPEVMGELDNKVRSLVFDGVIL